jgi:hypothetical protein
MTLISACTDEAFRNGVLPMAFLCKVEAVAHNDNVAAWMQTGARRLPLPTAFARVPVAPALVASGRAGMKKALRRKAKGLGKLHLAEYPADDYPAIPSACM